MRYQFNLSVVKEVIFNHFLYHVKELCLTANQTPRLGNTRS